MNYFLHIGLHKTGTKYLQYKVFSKINDKDIIYNPPLLTQYIADLLKAENGDVENVKRHINKEKNRLKKSNQNKVLISREIMSGDCFRLYPDYREIHKRLGLVFPDAKIIIFLRNQFDWIQSLYRETVHMYHYQSFNEFICTKYKKNKFVTGNIYNLNYKLILESLYNNFNNKNIYILFHEDLKKDKRKSLDTIKNIIQINKLEEFIDNDKIPNRGYSALAIKLSILRYKLFKLLHIEKIMVHRPIYMMGKFSVPAGFENLTILNKNKYWSKKFYRDNEEVRNTNYPDNLSFIENMRLIFSWRNFTKKILDKFFYIDWKLIDKKTEIKFKKQFLAQNIEIEKEFKLKLPDQYHYKIN